MTKLGRGLRAAMAAACLFGAAGAQATEGGQTTSAAGAEGFLAGALPPAGFYGLVYVNHYRADRFNDGHGDEMIPDFKVRATAVVARGVWMADTSFLGGQPGFYAAVPFVHASVDAAGASDSHTGLGDIELAPLVAWHFSPELHAAFAPAIVVPSGSYDKDRMVNTGNNYTTFRPVFVFSYLGANGIDAAPMASMRR